MHTRLAFPTPRPHQDTVVALGLQRVICGHKDGVGFGSLDLGHQSVVLGIETALWQLVQGANQPHTPQPSGKPFPLTSLLRTFSCSPKRRKAGTFSSCCSNPGPVCMSLLEGNKTWRRAGGAVCQTIINSLGSCPLSLSRHTWLTMCRTPLVARRSGTSTVAFCTQTL